MKEFLKNKTIRKYWFLKLLLNKKQTFLYQTGWIRSYQEKKPVDLAGNPQPWLSISALLFLDERLNSNLRVLEYGAGNSTIYFSGKCALVESIEHDKKWFDYTRNLINAENSEIHFHPLGDNYINASHLFEGMFDVILIDGRLRVECAKSSVEKLSPRGVLILDDSEREKYSDARDFLTKAGFRELKFWGFNLGSTDLKCTSIFYKENNCLKI